MNDPMLIFLSLFFSAYFSGMEIAFVSANKLRIALMKRKGWLAGRLLSRFLSQPAHFIITSLVGNNIALVIFGIAMARLLEPPIKAFLPGHAASPMHIIAIQTAISTIIILFCGEFIPKVLFRINPGTILSFFIYPFQLIYYIFYPFVVLLNWLSKTFLSLFFGKQFRESNPAFGKIDLEYYLQESDKAALREEANLDPKVFQKALYFREIKVRECMVPRTEVIAVDVQADIGKLRRLFINTKLSKIIVYNKSIDNVIGYVHHFAMLDKPSNIHAVTMSIPLVTETMTAAELLKILTHEQKTIAWVVDEFGGTAGIVTLEDVFEEIFGEIEDEFDEEELVARKVDANTYIFSARLEVDYLNEKYNLDLPTGEYETLAGLVIAHHESIPKENVAISLKSIKLTVLESSKKKIEKVKLEKIPEED